MLLRLFLCTCLLITGSGQSYYPTPSPFLYSLTSIMSGSFKYEPEPGDNKVWEEYMKVWGVETTENQGKNISSELFITLSEPESPSYSTTFRVLEDGSGVDIDYQGQWTLPLLFGQEVTTTEPALGKEMKSFSWRTGPTTFSVVNRVEEDGISERKSLVFYPHGVQVFSTVTRSDLHQEATLYEWLERVDEDGEPLTVYVR